MSTAIATCTWPFWAPTPADAIERALDLAGVGVGCRFMDLGCGDGRVMEAALRRGALAVGYEASPPAAASARERLASFGARFAVFQADFHRAPLEADVLFAFLSPATLFRLRDRLAGLRPGTRIVTHAYGVVGWQADRVDKGCFLYTMPPKSFQQRPLTGWNVAGLAATCPSGRTVLVAALFGAQPGPLDVEVSTTFPDFGEVYPGLLRCDGPVSFPVDIKLNAGPAGDLRFGGVRIQGHELLVWLAAAGDRFACRRLNAEQLDIVRDSHRRVRAGQIGAESLLQGIDEGPPVDAGGQVSSAGAIAG